MTKRSRVDKLPVEEAPDFEVADVYAIQALFEGTANEGQQKRALAWIINGACAYPVDPFRAENARLSDHLTGRQSVARMLLYMKQNAGAIANAPRGHRDSS